MGELVFREQCEMWSYKSGAVPSKKIRSCSNLCLRDGAVLQFCSKPPTVLLEKQLERNMFMRAHKTHPATNLQTVSLPPTLLISNSTIHPVLKRYTIYIWYKVNTHLYLIKTLSDNCKSTSISKNNY